MGAIGAAVEGLALFVAWIVAVFSSGALFVGLMVVVVDSAGRIS